jgi:hypothetical protein
LLKRFRPIVIINGQLSCDSAKFGENCGKACL